MNPVRLLKAWIPLSAKLWLYRLIGRGRAYWRVTRDLGVSALLDLRGAERHLRQSTPAPRSGTRHVSARLRGYPQAINYRPGSSDILVIRNVLINQEYSCVGDEADVKLIVDAGANIGCSAIYFLTRYPNAHVIAIEPDRQNFELCRSNLAPFGARAEVLQAGLWPDDVGLHIERGTYRDGMAWSIQVAPAAQGEHEDIRAVNLATVLAGRTADLVKMDIEGAEVNVFARNYESWLPHARTLVIELHDSECERVVELALANVPHLASKAGGLTVYRGLGR